MGKNCTLQTVIALLANLFLLPFIFIPLKVTALLGRPVSQFLDFTLYRWVDGFVGTLSGAFSARPELLILAAAFLFLCLVPFIPGIMELFWPKDVSPQMINTNYVKDARYFEKSFVKFLNDSLGDNKENGVYDVTLSRNEKVEITGPLLVKSGLRTKHILLVNGELKAGKDTVFDKEIYVRGIAVFGEGAKTRAVAGTGDIIFMGNTRITRWASTPGNIVVADGGFLGVRVTCDGELKIGRKCRFMYLFGNPILTMRRNPMEYSEAGFSAGAAETAGKEKYDDIGNSSWFMSGGEMVMPPATKIDKDIIIKGNITIKSGCEIRGSIKAGGDIFIEHNSLVTGNIFSEGNVVIGQQCSVLGNIFCQNMLKISDRVVIGAAGSVKTAIGKKRVELGCGVVAHGYILCQGTGRTV